MFGTARKIGLSVSLKLTELFSTTQEDTGVSHLGNCPVAVCLSQLLHFCLKEWAVTSKGMKRHSDGLLSVRHPEQAKGYSNLHQISSHKEPAELCESSATSVLTHIPISCPLVVDVTQQKFGKCMHTRTQALGNPNDSWHFHGPCLGHADVIKQHCSPEFGILLLVSSISQFRR